MPASRAPLTALHGLERLLYRACDCACDARQLSQSVGPGPAGPVSVSADEVARRLEPLLERGLMVKDRTRYLALAIPLGRHSPSPGAVERFYDLARSLGRRVPAGWIVSPSASLRAGSGSEGALGTRSRRRRRLPAGEAVRLRASQFSVGARGEVLIRGIPR